MDNSEFIDQSMDLTGATTHRLTQLYEPPTFVKQASHEDLNGDPETLQPHVYAFQAKRRLPCHTKAATWMSALFFQDNRKNLAPAIAEQIEAKLLKSAAWWNIKNDVVELWEKMANDKTRTETSLPDELFALVWDVNGNKERRYPLRNAKEVKMASHWFGQYHGEFRFKDKHKIAQKILVKAAEYGAMTDNTELLNRCAGYGYSACETAADAWKQRARLLATSQRDFAEQAHKVAESLAGATFEARDQGIRIKMASLMDDFDRETGLAKLYGEGLDRPEDTLFGITEKVASSFVDSHVITTTGAVYDKMALDSLDSDTVQSWMGSDFVDAVGGLTMDADKIAEILPTLPRDDAKTFENMARAAGIPIIAREKEASTGIPEEELHELAKGYKDI